MEKKLNEGWARVNGVEVLEELEKGLTPRLNAKAQSQENKSLVLDKAKMSIAEFIRDWFLEKSLWDDQKISSINISFSNENSEGGVFN